MNVTILHSTTLRQLYSEASMLLLLKIFVYPLQRAHVNVSHIKRCSTAFFIPHLQTHAPRMSKRLWDGSAYARSIRRARRGISMHRHVEHARARGAAHNKRGAAYRCLRTVLMPLECYPVLRK